MPVNCPLCYSGLCSECTNLYNKKCYARPLCPVPITDILTDHERITILEDRLDKQPPLGEFLNALAEENENMKGEMLYLRNRITEHLAKSAELRKKSEELHKKKKSKYA